MQLLEGVAHRVIRWRPPFLALVERVVTKFSSSSTPSFADSDYAGRTSAAAHMRRRAAEEPLFCALCHLTLSSATGQLRLLLYIPDRSKQQGRRFPLASMSQAVAIRFTRVSGRLGETIQ